MPMARGTRQDDVEARFIEAHHRLFGPGLNGEPGFLHSLRQKAIGRFGSMGFPSKKDEAWKYTSLRGILRTPLAVAPDCTAPPPSVRAIHGLDAHIGVFVNGRLHAGLSVLASLPAGVTIAGLGDAPPALVAAHLARQADFRGHAFVALNTAFLSDGAFVHVPDGTVLDKPVHLIHVITGRAPTLAQPRTLVIAGTGAQVNLIDTISADLAAPSLVNSVTEVFVAAGARVARFEVQDPAAHVSLVTALSAYQLQDSHFQNNSFTFGGQVVRNNIAMLPDAAGCETLLHGLFIARGRAHVDNHTLVDHAKPDCYSAENYRGILDDRATGVFNGKVLVRQDAQRINAYQSNKSIVLSNTARMFAKPELEIYADDVKCSHGATTGQLDAEALFYLRARGLTMSQARTLMLQAFARDIVDKVPIEPLRSVLDERIAAILAR